MIKLFFSNLGAILTLKPNYASNSSVKTTIRLVLGVLYFIGVLFIFWLLYAVTISPMIELGLFKGKDLNYDGLYTYKDALLSIFTPGGAWLINICNIFTTPGNFFEFDPISYKYGNIIKFGLLYIFVGTPIWLFGLSYWLQEIIDNRLEAKRYKDGIPNEDSSK